MPASAEPVDLTIRIENLRTNLIDFMDKTVALYCQDSILYNIIGNRNLYRLETGVLTLIIFNDCL